ncbi:MAG: sugar transferase [Flexilinea sp.]|nr:sugar transferase [Flexilinea sp.]
MADSNSLRATFKQRLTHRERKFILIFGHVIAVLLALGVSLLSWATEDDWLGLSLSFLMERPDTWFYLLPLLWLILMIPLYNEREVHQFQKALRITLTAALSSVAIYLLIFFLAPAKTLPRRGVIVFFIAAAVFTLLWRRIYARLFLIKDAFINTVIVGAGKAGTRIAEIINTTEGVPYRVVGFIDDDPVKIGAKIEGYPVLGNSDRYFDIVEKNQVTQIIMAISNHLDDKIFDALTRSEERGITVTTMPVIYEELLGRVPVHLLNTDWLLRSFYDMSHSSLFFEIAKRLFDILGGLVGMVFLALITPFAALATLIDTGRPVFYTQERLGLRGSTFNIIKFRTMVQNAEMDGVARPASEHDSRITKVGSFLRRSHLDEMPQFLNVLRGELSLVGPRAERPQIVKDLQREVPFYRARLLVRPGITGWAQVNQNYAAGTEENTVKLEYDLYYIKHRSLLMDLSIIFNTLKTIFGLKGR